MINRQWLRWIPSVLMTLACASHAAVRPSSAGAPLASSATSRLSVFNAAISGSGPRLLSAKLDGTLAHIAQGSSALTATQSLASLHALNPAAHFRAGSLLAAPEVLIDAVASNGVAQLQAALEGLGLQRSAVFRNVVGGWLPVDQLEHAANLSQLRFARASMPRTRAAVATQGDFVQGSATARSSYPSLTGSGVTVGVLSDSFNCYQTYASNGTPASGYAGYAFNGFTATYGTDESTDALPSGVSVLEEADCTDYGAPYQTPFTDEGRAILQIVHVVAPSASLAFYTGADSEADFANGIVKLAEAGATVIDDDIGYPDEPFFEDGLLAQAVDQVAALGVSYFSSAGNDATNSYENTNPSFTTTSTSAPNSGEKLLNFDPSGATDTTSLSLTIPQLYPGEFIPLVVEWDQPYVTGCSSTVGSTSATCTGSSNQIDLCVSSASGSDLVTDESDFPSTVSCTGANAVGTDPVQILIIGNPANASEPTAVETITIQIGLVSGSVPGRIKFLLDDDGAGSTINAFATHSPTIQGHPGAAGAVAVGAAFFFDTPACGTTPATLESFSSVGGDPILFDSSQAGSPRLTTPVTRPKPDFVAPDGVSNTFLGGSLEDYGFASNTLDTNITQCQEIASGNSYYPNFFGTSAAAPHAAAVAALMLQANPALTTAQMISALQANALPMATVTTDWNYSSGAGLIQVDSVFTQLPLAAPALSISAATITEGSSATLTWSSIGTTGCTASGAWSGALASSGTQTVKPTATGSETFTLLCTNSVSTSADSSVMLTVNAPSSSSGGGGAIDALTVLTLMGLLLLKHAARPRRVSNLR